MSIRSAYDTCREFLRLLADRFIAVRCEQVAASLTVTTLLALVPLVTVSLVLFSNFPVFDALGGALRGFLLDNLLPQKAGDVIAKYSLQFSQNAGQLTVLGSLILVATVVITLFTIDRAFNSIFHVARPPRSLRRLLIYWSVITLGPLLLGASIAATSYIASASLGLINESIWVRSALFRALPLLFFTLLLTFLYFAVPNRRIRLRDALAGGVAAAGLFSLVQKLFGLYIARFPTYTLIYGAFATLPIFLIWLYLSWNVVLIGALITAVLPEFGWGSRVAPPFPGRNTFGALLILRELGEAQRVGGGRSGQRLAVTSRQSEADCELLLERLRDESWITRNEEGQWMLARRLDDIALRDVFARFAFSPRGVPVDALDDPLTRRLLALHEQAAERLAISLAELFA
jgi:membrane protein